MPAAVANRSRRSVSRGRSPTKKAAKSPVKKSSKSKSPTKKRAASKSPKKTTPKKQGRPKSRGRSKSVTKTAEKKTPARSTSRARSRTPARKTPAAKNTPKATKASSASAIKVSVKKLASSAAKSAKALTDYTPSSNGRSLRKRFDHSVGAESGSGHTKAKQSTVGSLLASVRGYQSPTRRGRYAQKWYMYHGYNVLVLALMFAVVLVTIFAGYHYRHDVNAQINRLRARGVQWYNK